MSLSGNFLTIITLQAESFEVLSYQWFKDDEKLVGEDKSRSNTDTNKHY